MTKKHSTQKSLMASVLSLLLCFSMLIGTTFAWFTDSVTSANNIIKSGNLDVELEYWNGTQYTKVTDETKLFNDDALWEPGHTEVAYLKISNVGSLALKYQLNVNVVKEIIGKTATGADLKLSDHLVFGVVDKEITSAEDLYSREGAIAAAGVTKGLRTYNGETKALVNNGDADYVALIIYMPTTVGNEANHDGEHIPSIEMGVNVVATQYTYEEDSLGTNYDSGATYLKNTSKSVAVPDNATEGVVLKTEGESAVNVEVPAEVLNSLPAEVTSISLGHSEPKVESGVVVFDSIELIDQNGNIIDLEKLDLGENITVTLSLPENIFTADDDVMVYHDGAYVAMATVDANGNITYSATHFCEVTVGAAEAPTVNEETGTVEIANASQLISFAADVNSGNNYAGKTVVLTADIDLKNGAWTPIGNFTYDITTNGDGYVYGETFKGTFDGQGHTIKNLYVNAPNTSGVGLFGYVTDATVKNLTIENVKLNALSHVAAFVARARGTATVTNCKLIGDIDINAYWAYVAGIVGKAYAINLDGCSVAPNGTGKITSENRNAVGSILAWMESASTVSNCEAQNLNLTGWANIGAITGFVNNGGTVANCSAKNITLTKTRADGIGTIGLAAGGWSGNNITIKDNIFDTITLNGNMVPHESVNILFGGEFYANGNASTVATSNNTQTNITDNRVEVTVVSTANGLKDALAAGGNIVLANDLSFGYFVIDKDVVIDLNGNTFEATNNITLSDDAKLTMKGGNFVVNQTSAHINAGKGNVLTFEDVNCSYNVLSRTNGSGGTNRLGSVFSINSTKDGVKTVVEFKNCTLNNMQVSFTGNTNCTGTIEATFENCTFDALTNSAPIYINYNVKGTIEVTDCTFNIQATASDANAIWVNSTSSTAVTVVATNNTFNATKATPTDSSVTGVNVVQLSSTSFSNVSFIGNKGTTSSVTETGTIKTGIAK